MYLVTKLVNFQNNKKELIFVQKQDYKSNFIMDTIIITLLILVVLSQNKLVFYDEFNFLDFKKWKHDLTMAGGGNGEFQMYINNRTVTYTNNSILYIQPVPLDQKIGADRVRNNSVYQIWGGSPGDFCTGPFNNGCKRASNGVEYINPIMSGKLTTAESFTFTYGRVQVRAKLPKGDWIWPAIWMMPRYFQYGDWPASGEIDIMESRGNVGYPREYGGGPETFGSTLHWGSDWTTNQWYRTSAQYTLNGSTFADEFHTFGLYWDQKAIYTYLDNDTNRVLVVNNSNFSFWQRSGLEGTGRANPWEHSPNKCAPFDREFYLIMNVAVGGTNYNFQDGVANKPWSDKSPRASAQFFDNKGQWFPTWKKGDSALQVDFVKIWDLSQDQQIAVQ